MQRILVGITSETEFLRRGQLHAALILKEAPQGMILDFGCGIGRVLRFLPPERSEGYDTSERMRTLAREWCGRTVLASLDGKEEFYNTVFEILVLQHCPHGEHITAMLNTLKRGGKLISLHTFNMPSPEIPLPLENEFKLEQEIVKIYKKTV